MNNNKAIIAWLNAVAEGQRESLTMNLQVLSELAKLPLAVRPNIETAVIERMREIGTLVNEQHSRLHQLKTVKVILRKCQRMDRIDHGPVPEDDENGGGS